MALSISNSMIKAFKLNLKIKDRYRVRAAVIIDVITTVQLHLIIIFFYLVVGTLY